MITTENNQPVIRKALSLWQPWASLIALGYKKCETRSWYTTHRGELIICAAKKDTRELRFIYDNMRRTLSDKGQILPAWEELPKGTAIALVNQDNCLRMTDELIASQSPTEFYCGDWQTDRFAHCYSHIKELEPVPIKGHQGLFNVEGRFQLKGSENYV